MDEARLAAWLARGGTTAPGARGGQLSERERLLLDPLLDVRASGGPTLPPPTLVQTPLQYAIFNNVTLSAGVASAKVLDAPSGGARRVYLFVVNTHPTQIMFLAFGTAATLLNGIPILNNFGFYELNAVISQDDLYLIGNGAATTGVLVYANKIPDGLGL